MLGFTRQNKLRQVIAFHSAHLNLQSKQVLDTTNITSREAYSGANANGRLENYIIRAV